MYGPPTRYWLMISSASCLSSGVKSITFSSESPSFSSGAGFVGKGCVGESLSPGTNDCVTGRSSIGQTGSPVTRLKVKVIPCLVVWMTIGTSFPSTVTSARIGTLGRS